MLKEIFTSLRLIHSGGRIQFDILMSEFIDSYHEHRRNDGASNINNLNPKIYIPRDIRDIDKKFLDCLILYVNSNEIEKREKILDWFVDGLSDEEAIAFGLPLRNLEAMSDERREQEAENVLIFLGQILAYSKVSMVVCFDELDAIKDKDKDKELISAWGNLISFLMNNLSGILPLCFMQTQTWNDVFFPALSNAVVQRLTNNKMIMNTCSINQAQQLVRSKINSAFKDEKISEEIYNWLINRIKNIYGDSNQFTPREIKMLSRVAKSCMSTSLGLEPCCGPTMPAFSI